MNNPANIASDYIITRERITKMLQNSVKNDASDVFLAPDMQPAARIHGEIVYMENEIPFTSISLSRYLEQHVSVEELNRFEATLELDFSHDVPKCGRFRVNAFMQLEGISMVFRKVPLEIPSFASLQLPSQLRSIVDFKQGLVLMAGAMGMGKSTTLASIVDLINESHHKHIVTIEDPIEFVHKNKTSLIEQRELGLHTKSFSNAIRSCMRQGADVILIGELRDLDTVEMAIRASETGALVLATIHTNGATRSIDRIIDMYPGPQQGQIRTQLAQSLRAVIWQTLLPKKDGIGRIPAFEIMFHTLGVANLIRQGKTYQLNSILETSQGEGMVSMRQYIEALVANNLVHEKEALGFMDTEGILRN